MSDETPTLTAVINAVKPKSKYTTLFGVHCLLGVHAQAPPILNDLKVELKTLESVLNEVLNACKDRT